MPGSRTVDHRTRSIGAAQVQVATLHATLTAMTVRTHLQLIQGGNELQQADLTDLLENMDVSEALPQLRALARRRKPAANSALTAVDAVTQADLQPSPGELDSHAPR